MAANLKKQPEFRPTNPNWAYYETIQPTVTSQVESENTSQPKPFDLQLRQNDLNDSFDQKRLLKLVPKPHKKNALKLLEIWELRPNDISYNCQGTLFINNESVPGTNIFKIFPAIFAGKKSSHVAGLDEVIQKLKEMNLEEYIPSNTTAHLKVGRGLLKSTTKWYFLK